MKSHVICKFNFLLMLWIITCIISPVTHASDTLTAISFNTLHNHYQSHYMIGANIFADSNRLINITLTNDGDSTKQIADIKKIVETSKGNVVFFIDPYDDQTAFLLAEYLEKQQIFWVSAWNKPNEIKVWDYKFWVSHFSYDGFAAGRFTARMLVDSMNGKGKILIIQGDVGSAPAIDRVQGMHDILNRYAKVKIAGIITANWSRDLACKKTREFLKVHPDIKAVWAANDTMALGALDAIRESGKLGKIQVSGIDGEVEMLERIKAGEVLCTVYNNAVHQSGIGVALAYAAKSGKINPVKLPHEHRQFYATGINVNKENVDSVIKTYITHIPNYNFKDYFSAFTRKMY